MSAQRSRRGDPERESRLDARERARQARRRAALERASFDPAPPTDDDWTIAEQDTDGLRRVPEPTPIGTAIAGVVARRGWQERVQASTVWSRWEEVVGPQLRPHCQPVRIAGRTLVIRADSQVWATQLRYLGPQLLSNLTAVLGDETVDDVRVTVGPLEVD